MSRMFRGRSKAGGIKRMSQQGFHDRLNQRRCGVDLRALHSDASLMQSEKGGDVFR